MSPFERKEIMKVLPERELLAKPKRRGGRARNRS